jgi:Asp-tRNA(Asn)/Glu-tRNA(Gln) amidotransferase A subunit family amidase
VSKIKPHSLSAGEALAQMRAGRLSSVQLVRSCLDRIAETDGQIKAWAHLDDAAALAQAEAADRHREKGLTLGALHGIPVALKDIIDTRDMPCERGTPIFEGRQPDADARIVERLREAGAVIMGKTTTTELAFLHASDTRNPHDPDRTPGGSSSGSAAAVAAEHVPLAVGSQTGGSVIRPASFCGTFGFKPTRGLIPRTGVLQTSVSLDHLGTFSRTLHDTALLADVLGCYDQRDPESWPHPRPDSAAGAASEPPVEPDLIWFDLPFHDRLDEAAREGLEGVLEVLGPRVTRSSVADNLPALVEVQETIHEYEICQHLAETFEAHWDMLSDTLKPIVTRGRGISRTQYEDALAVKKSAESFFDELFADYDAVVAPSATGEAPAFGPGTGDAIFCKIWTLAGLPCVTLPLLVGENGLPIGVQLIGAPEKDDRLMRTAHWLQKHLAAAAA